MLSNTLSIIEMTIQRKMNKNIDSIALTNFFKNYRKNMWIYPGVLKRKFSLSIPEIYDFLSELEKQGLIEEKDAIEKLKLNLLQSNTKMTYRSIKKVKNDYQENIIHSLKKIIYNSRMSLIDFAKYIDMNSQILDSILQKKRFIELDELIGISEKFKISVNDIIDG